jgi:cytidylate kinase
MIIGLFGPSSVGKTTIARLLSTGLGLPLRSCGEVVRDRAAQLALSPKDLPDEEHTIIDNDTRVWASSHQLCLVEGRYLDYVLAPIRSKVILVRLEATKADRQARQKEQGPQPLTLMHGDPDEIDRIFCTRMYKNIERISPSLMLSSSELSVEACVQRVKTWIIDARAPPD